MRRAPLLLVIAVAFLLVPRPAPAAGTPFAWPQFGFDERHSLYNPFETTINRSNVSSLKRLYSVPLVNPSHPSAADGTPIYLGGVDVHGETRDLLFVNTLDGWTLALDAHTGQQVWGKQYGPNGCVVAAGFQAGVPCYTTASPALDPNRQFVYSYGLDGYAHKYRVASGDEVRDPHWPELVSTKPAYEKESSALGTATDRTGTTYLYIVTSGFLGDEGDYQGHLTAVNLETGSQHVFNAMCSDRTDVHFALAPATPACRETHSAIWSRSGVVRDPASDLIFFSTGNGTFDAANHFWGDSVLALHADGTGIAGNPVDSYTPTDQATLDGLDEDLGSTGPVLLPTIPNSKYPHLAIQGKKIERSNGAADIRLINLDNLSGNTTRGPGHLGGEIGSPYSLPQGGFIMTQAAVWVDPAAPGRPWVFIANEYGIIGLQVYVDAGRDIPSFHLKWSPVSGGRPSPVVANGVLYYLSSTGVQALDPTRGTHLWSDTGVHTFHWESPIVANGNLYVTDETGHLTAYGLDPTSIPTVAFKTVHKGKQIAFTWRVSSQKGIHGFFVFAGQKQLSPTLIPRHAALTSRYVARWTKKTVPAFSLRVVMDDGRQFSVPAR